MSLDVVRDYVKGELSSLGLNLMDEAFDVDSISRTQILKGAFHVSLGTALNRGTSQNNIEIEQPFTVKLLIAGHNKNSDAVTLGISKADAVIDALTKIENFTGTPIINVLVKDKNIMPMSERNDDIVAIDITFSALLVRARS